MKNTAIIYSYHSKNSSRIAGKIIHEFGTETIDAINAEDLTKEQFLSYSNLILSSPTWFDGELASYWDEFIPELERMELKNKVIAVFGMGNQQEYPENFGDAVGILAEIVEKQGARLTGDTSVEGYSFEKSKALKEGRFVGLLIDDGNHEKLIEERIKNWVQSIKKDFR